MNINLNKIERGDVSYKDGKIICSKEEQQNAKLKISFFINSFYCVIHAETRGNRVMKV